MVATGPTNSLIVLFSLKVLMAIQTLGIYLAEAVGTVVDSYVTIGQSPIR